MRSRTGWSLVGAAVVLSLGHHLDHVVRGNHTGWPVTAEVTPFTYSLAVYPVIALGVFLTLTGRAGPRFWMLVSGPGALFLLAVHAGPAALEPPRDILGAYSVPGLGPLAFAWLVLLVATLAVTFGYELRLWRRERAVADGG